MLEFLKIFVVCPCGFPKDKTLAKKAVKSDMCKDIKGGAACVRSCPTGAALRVSPEKFLAYTSDR